MYNYIQMLSLKNVQTGNMLTGAKTWTTMSESLRKFSRLKQKWFDQDEEYRATIQKLAVGKWSAFNRKKALQQ